MSDVTKPVKAVEPELSMTAKLSQSVKKIVENDGNEYLGKATSFNHTMHDKKIEKLQSYGTKWDKYGYNPNRDNEKFYDNITSDSEQWVRSLKGAWKLADVGFNDSFLFGAFADSKKNAHKFEQAADMYSTQRGGVTGFAQNLTLNAGYTVGIVADMVAEELGLFAVTALSGGTAAPGTVPLMGAKAGSAISKIVHAFSAQNKLRKSIQAVNIAADATKTSKIGSKLLNVVNPFSHSTNYIKSLKKIDDVKSLSNLGKITHGGAAIFRDVKAGQLAYSEALLESNILENDLYKDYFDKNPYATKEEADAFSVLAKDAKNYSLISNTLAIAATNKLVFNNMYKRFDDLRGVGRFLSGNRFGRIASTGAGSTVIRTGNVFQKGFYQGIGDTFKHTFNKGLVSGLKKTGKAIGGKSGTYLTSNFGEGIQESVQETIASANKDWVLGKKGHGSYFDSIVHGMKDQFTAQGGETFLSGFLMGGLVSPITNSITKPLSWLQSGTNPIEALTSPTSYKQKRETALKQLELDSKIINESFQNVGNVFNSMGNELASQIDIDEQLIDSAAQGDRKTFQDKKDESYRNHLHVMMKHNMMDEFIKHVEGFKTMTPQQASESFGMSSTLDQSKINDMVSKKVAQAKRFKTIYSEFKSRFPGPIKPDPKSKTYNEEVTYYHLYNRSIDELIFNSAEVEQNIDRKKELMDNLAKEFESNNISFHEYSKLFEEDTINSEIDALTNEVELLKSLENSPEAKPELKSKQAKLNTLIRFKESAAEHNLLQDELEELMKKDTLTAKDKKQIAKLEKSIEASGFRIYKRHNEYLKNISDTENTQFQYLKEETFQKFYDYFLLDKQNKRLNKNIEILTNPNLLDEIIQRMSKYDQMIIDNHKAYVKNSIAKFRDSEHGKEVVQELLAKGIAFDLKYMDDLMNKGIIPKVFYDLHTEEELKLNDPKHIEAEEVLNELVDNLIERPIREKDDDLLREIGRGVLINEDDKRTLSDLGEEFGFDPTAESSTVNTEDVLNKIIASKDSEPQEKELARLILKDLPAGSKITFVKNAKRPNSYSKEKGSVIDARYSSQDFTNSIFSIEESILKNELERIALSQLEDSAFKKEITNLLEITRVAAKDDKNASMMKGLDNELEFIKEGFANKMFQALLISVETPVNKKSVWSNFVDAVIKSFGFNRADKDYDSSVFNYLTRIVAQKTNINNLESPTRTTPSSPTSKTDEENKPSLPESDATINTPIEELPQEVITMLIDEYLIAVEDGDVQGVDKDNLTETNLTKEFISWANNSVQLEEYLESNKKETTSNDVIDNLTDEQVEKLVELGYTGEDINKMSLGKINLVISKSIENANKTDVNEAVIDNIIENKLNKKNEEDSLQEKPADTGTEGTSSTDGSETTEKETTKNYIVVEQKGKGFALTLNDEYVTDNEGQVTWYKTSEEARAQQVKEKQPADQSEIEKTFTVVKDGITYTNQKIIKSEVGGDADFGYSTTTTYTDVEINDDKDFGDLVKGATVTEEKTKNETSKEKPVLTTNKEKHTAVVDRLKNGEKVTITLNDIDSKSAVAKLDTGEKVFFYNKKAEPLSSNDINQIFELRLVPELKVEGKETFFNVVEVYKDGVYYGNLAENDFGELKPSEKTEVIKSEAELREEAENLVEEEEVAFVDMLGTEKQKEEAKATIEKDLIARGFSKKQIKDLSLEQQIYILSKDNFTRKDYLKELRDNIKAEKIQQVNEALEKLKAAADKKINDINTKEDLDNYMKTLDVTLDLSLIAQVKNYILEKLSNVKDYSYIKVGQLLQLKDGTIVKVASLSKKGFKVVDYNSIISNEKIINKQNFEEEVSIIINDFNKDTPELKSKINEDNITSLSNILSNFNPNSKIEDVSPEDVDLTEHFNKCK
jgi:hypothetical protein